MKRKDKKEFESFAKEMDKLMEDPSKIELVDEEPETPSQRIVEHDSVLLGKEEYETCGKISKKLQSCPGAFEYSKYFDKPHAEDSARMAFDTWKKEITSYWPDAKFDDLHTEGHGPEKDFMKYAYACRFKEGRPLLFLFLSPDGHVLFMDESFIDYKMMGYKPVV